ncbi:MAG: cobalamin biosynthesis protein, partial [Haloechinothrix sp.]
MSAGRAIGLVLGVIADALAGDRTSRQAARHRGATPPPALVSGAAVLAGTALDRLGKRSTLLRIGGTALAAWGVLGGAALAARGTALVRELETGDLDAARDTLAPIDPRCTEALDGVGLTRASVEALAGNTSATVVGPLLWGALAGTPGLLVHHGVKTAKAVVARRRAEHRTMAEAVDRADELVDLLPTRYTA